MQLYPAVGGALLERLQGSGGGGVLIAAACDAEMNDGRTLADSETVLGSGAGARVWYVVYVVDT